MVQGARLDGAAGADAVQHSPAVRLCATQEVAARTGLPVCRARADHNATFIHAL